MEIIFDPSPEEMESLGFKEDMVPWETDQNNPHHDFDIWIHTTKVLESLVKITPKDIKKDPELYVIRNTAALLHDIGKIKLNLSKVFSPKKVLDTAHQEWPRHCALGVPIAKKFLKNLGHSDEFIEQVCYVIKNHDQRGKKMKDKTVELEIVQDADLIADCGFAGFVRPFLYGTKFQRSIVDTIRYIQMSELRAEEDKLNLSVYKKLAKQEMKVEKRLDREIASDIKSDLLK